MNDHHSTLPASLAVPRTTAKEIPERRHRLQEQVNAARDIRIYRTTVIACGAPGIVVAIHADPGRENYTVEFQQHGLAGATIRVRGLTDADLQERGPPGETWLEYIEPPIICPPGQHSAP